MVFVNCVILDGGQMPTYATDGSSGLDLYAAEAVIVPAARRADDELETVCLGRVCVRSGVAVELPDGVEAQVRPRSGMARTHGVFAIAGTIDRDYRGEIGVTLVNTTEYDYSVRDGDRIAQLVIAPVLRAHLLRVSALSTTKRGPGGFGSTGR